MFQKIILGLAVILFLFIEVKANGQRTYSLTISDKSARVLNGNSKSMFSYCTIFPGLGRDGNQKYRSFFQWPLPDDQIPDGSTVTSARLYITSIELINTTNEVDAGLYSVEIDIENASAQTLWDRTNWFFNNLHYYYIGPAQSQNYVIDKTFQQGSDFTTALEKAIEDDYFALGIIEFREETHEYAYKLNNCEVKLEFHYTLPTIEVTVDQKRSDGASVGHIGRWEGGPDFESYSVPETFDFNITTTEVLRGWQALLENPSEKYKKWNISENIKNHHEFDVTYDMSGNLVSEFDQVYENATMKNEFMSAPGADPSDDIIEFKDPWLIDYADSDYGDNERNRGMDNDGPDKLEFKERSSPFSPDYETNYDGDVYQGVFLDQDYNIPGHPYYSLRASEDPNIPFHGQDITWYFQNWTGSDVDFEHADQNETAVVFQQPNAAAEAVYKGHLASNKARATGHNNGRRICRTQDDNLHLVYEDDGSIWYSQSTNNGETWSKEQRLSSLKNPNRYCLNPAITRYSSEPQFVMV
ncbi:MAG: hypothetical protein GF313_14195 [Caldithrix sp.]|nr:hypothetical protein [Caldithrix sp.]